MSPSGPPSRRRAERPAIAAHTSHLGKHGHSVVIARSRSRGLLSVLEAEAELQSDLDVADGAVLDVTPDLGHLEPVEVTSRSRCSFDRVADGAVDGSRAADDLDDPVCVIRHGTSQ